jgi:transporter family-2 protein
MSITSGRREQRTTGRTIAVAATVVVGAVLAFVAPIDGGLSRTTGALPAALVDFAGGALLLVTVLAVTRRLSDLRSVRGAPPALLLGGACGACFVVSGVVTIDALGAGGVAAATVTGQLTASVLIDRAGLLGLPRRPLTARRLAGVGLLIGGTLLITS